MLDSSTGTDRQGALPMIPVLGIGNEEEGVVERSGLGRRLVRLSVHVILAYCRKNGEDLLLLRSSS